MPHFMILLKSHNRQAKIMIDDSAFDAANQHKWSVKRNRNYDYAYTIIDGRIVYLHRFLMDDNGLQIDHIDRNGLNNQISNLRLVSRSENQFNSRKRIGTRSKYKGVSWHKQSGKWAANIKIKGKMVYLGLHQSEESAKDAYNKKASEIYPDTFALVAAGKASL
jgi:HNH endonuclease/AP2 domain